MRRALLLRGWRQRLASAAQQHQGQGDAVPSASAAPLLLQSLAASAASRPSAICAAARDRAAGSGASLLPFSSSSAAHQQPNKQKQQQQQQQRQASLPPLSEILGGGGGKSKGHPQAPKQQQQQQHPKRGGGGVGGGNGNGAPSSSSSAGWRGAQRRDDQERRERDVQDARAMAQDTAARLAARLRESDAASSSSQGGARRGGGGGGGGHDAARRGGGGSSPSAAARGRPAERHKQPFLAPGLARKQRSAAAAEERQKTRAAAAQQVAGRWASRLQALQQTQQQQGAAGAEADGTDSGGEEDASEAADGLGAAGGRGARNGQQQQQGQGGDASSPLREVVLSARDAEPGALTARRLAALLGCGAARVERTLADLGEPVKSEEDPVALDAAELAALELGAALIVGEGPAPPRAASASSADSASSSSSLLILEPRPPVVTVMGHVDHGKTSLLDALRSTDVAAGEAGGITQHIGAFSVELPGFKGRRITFLDTPGHAAFGAMRARGAAVTDVVVLVVAADDGVMPQTAEALAHARAAGCPVVVAITKCDVGAARPDAVRAQLAGELGLELEAFGGTVQCVETALPKGGGQEGFKGLRELEEALLLQAEVMELKAARRQRVAAAAGGGGGGGANGSGLEEEKTVPVRAAGTVVEAHVERGMGPVATVVVQRGELRVGDVVVCGSAFGRVRSLRAGNGNGSGSGSGQGGVVVGPGEHALVSGLRSLPSAGDELAVVADEDRAARIARARAARAQDYARVSLARARHFAAERRRSAAAAESARKKALSARLHELRGAKRHQAGDLSKALAEFAALRAGGGGGGEGESATTTVAADASDADNDSADADDDDQATTTTDAPSEPEGPLPDAPVIPFIIKADVQGSAEALRDAVLALPCRGTAAASVLLCAVGPCSLSDAHLAAATGARLLAFNVRPAGGDVEAALKSGGVRVSEHNVIYHLLDDVRELLEREGAAAAAGGGGGAGGAGGASSSSAQQAGEREVVVGSGTVLQTFPLLRKGKNLGTVAGLAVSSGSLVRSDATGSAAAAAAAAAALASAAGAKAGGGGGLPPGAQVVRLEFRLIRDGEVVAERLPCTDLRRQKLDVESVGRGTQCGVALEGGAWGGGGGGGGASAFAGAPRPGDVVECVAVVRGG